jgi:hypothetical protein
LDLSLREEPIGDAALVEHLDGACVQTACARAGEFLAGAPLHNGDVDARQRELARQHQPGRTAPGDHHRMIGLRPASIDTSTHAAVPFSLWSRAAFMRHDRGLAASPP